MAWFGQGKDTIEWNETRDDVLFYKWPKVEIKKGSHLIIRPGQKAIFYASGAVEGVFEKEGNFDVETEITPFLSTLKGWFQLRGDTGMRAEVYFINAKQLLLPWGTRQRIMIPSTEVPSGIPIGCNGNLVIRFTDYQKFITNIAGVKAEYTLDDISERIMGSLNGIVAEAILNGQQQVGMNALVSLQANNRGLSKNIAAALSEDMSEIGIGVEDVKILSINYPEEVQKMAEKVAAQSFVGDVGKYAAVNMADSFSVPNANGGGIAAMGAQLAMGVQMAQQMAGQFGGAAQPQQQQRTNAGAGGSYVCSGCGKAQAAPFKFCPDCGAKYVEVQTKANEGERFCPKCRKMVGSKFCPDCGTETV